MSEAPATQKKNVNYASIVAGTQGSSGVALVALWLNACLTAHHVVVPSNELMVIIVGWLAVPIIIQYKMYVNRLEKEATEEGLTS